jgi:ABC-type transport system involved in multi-copper enzyme maturation permease subunit
MMQTFAILLDSLRELRSRSLFWATLGVSVMVSVALFGAIGFDEKGWHILWMSTTESPVLRAGTPGARDLMSWLFGGVLLWWWLTWGAVLMALIATSSTIPEFLASGSIDVVLAKPIGRAKIYLVKVLGALLFMLMQVTASVLIAYLLLGLRFDMWFHGAWLAVPLVLLQFLYLFTVMAFVGLVTRSTLASLLAVLIFWGTVSLVQFVSNQMNRTVAEMTANVARSDKRIADIRAQAVAQGRELNTFEKDRIDSTESQSQMFRGVLDSLAPWKGPVNTLELTVPKTGDIQKIVANRVDAPTFNELLFRLQGMDPDKLSKMAGMNDRDSAEDMQQAGIAGSRAVRDVEPLQSIGTSLAFTLLVLGWSLWIFVRRDY